MSEWRSKTRNAWILATPSQGPEYSCLHWSGQHMCWHLMRQPKFCYSLCLMGLTGSEAGFRTAATFRCCRMLYRFSLAYRIQSNKCLICQIRTLMCLMSIFPGFTLEVGWVKERVNQSFHCLDPSVAWVTSWCIFT